MILRRQTPNLDYMTVGKRNVKGTLGEITGGKDWKHLARIFSGVQCVCFKGSLLQFCFLFVCFW